ncbi:hypothetical protein DJ67_000005 [Bacillus pumilus]|nr:hypothetical protein DJ67_000005 [Bacillus pumilus]
MTKDERSPLGFELQVKSIEVIHEATDYPITPKDSHLRQFGLNVLIVKAFDFHFENLYEYHL